ncbi:kinetochore Sim4 complex subunit FTA2-domain-containing protein [Annulohypoxylon stygium]|nr:kinetochore Sim4 complex subunit FTA2-domain-containing protein [Annulohypoxylon stygium]
MYPDWPESAADLLPLPRCDGPKLEPFQFHGPQKIEFLHYISEGLVSHVFKVRIEGEIYALKLFRFVDESVWGDEFSPENLDAPTLSVFADYSEPFNCECRAFGRLQETGNEDLANKCYGYLLLDEEHENIVMNQFNHPQIEFGGDAEGYGFDDARERFLGKDGRQPPIRGIVKEFGQDRQDLTTRVAKKYLRDIIRFQQLSIFNLDPGQRQLVDNKVADFTTAITIPHFMTNPELNPNLTPEQISDIEFQVFYLCSGDYWAFDEMIKDWNILHSSKLKVYAFPCGRGCHTNYYLRNQSPRRYYTYVDPRKLEGVSKKCKPARWYYDAKGKTAMTLRNIWPRSSRLNWELKDGHIFPIRRYPDTW